MSNLPIVNVENQPNNIDPCHKKFLMNERNKKKYVGMCGKGGGGLDGNKRKIWKKRMVIGQQDG
jgi:hypothetical protein